MWSRAGGGCGRRRALLLAIGALLFVIFLLLLQLGPSLPRPALLTPTLRAPARLLPHELWQHRRDHPDHYLQLSCIELPPLERIQWAAASWQRHRLPGGSLYLYAAHWDPRPAEPLVRLLVYSDVTPLPNLTCQLWYEGRNAPDTVPAMATYGWQPEWDGGPTDTVNEPYILSCPAQPEGTAPRAVSVAGTSCEEPRNVLAVQGASRVRRAQSAPDPTSVAACIKWLDYADDASADLVEWVELIRALGAQKLYVYVLQAHPNMRRVLLHYEELGFADVTELDQPPRERETGSQASRASRAMRRELLSLNDALYRAAPHYAWLAIFDMDELIVPLKDDTWSEVIARETREGRMGVDALVFRNCYFLEGAQRERAALPPAHMLAHVWRARNPSDSGQHVKSFHNTWGVVAMHNHMPISCIRGVYDCHVREVSLNVGRLQHYRSRCGSDKSDCPELHDVARDIALWRFARVLQTARAVLKELQIPLPMPRPITQPKTEIITEKPATLLEIATKQSTSVLELSSEVNRDHK